VNKRDANRAARELQDEVNRRERELRSEYQLVLIDKIDVLETARPCKAEDVAALAQGIQAIGLQNPIIVNGYINEDESHDFPNEDRYRLIAGRHRLEACRSLGHDRIPARVFGGLPLEDVDARLWTIAENLHRADLTVAERASQVAEWVRLTTEKAQPAKPDQVEQVSKGGRGKESGVAKAARDLGIDRSEVNRALNIDAITQEAKEAAAAAGLKTQADLLKIASYADADQVGAIAAIAAEKAKPKVASPAHDLMTPPEVAPLPPHVLEPVDYETPEQTDHRIFMTFVASTVDAAKMALEELAETRVKDEAYIGEMLVATNGVFRAWERIRNKLEDLEAAAEGDDDGTP
jgi:ParB-like nuclease domain